MDLIPGFLFLAAGTIVAVIGTVEISMFNPHRKIPLLIGEPWDFEFRPFLVKAIAFFLLMMSTVLLYDAMGVFAFLLIFLGEIPATILTVEHNRKVERDYGPEWW